MMLYDSDMDIFSKIDSHFGGQAQMSRVLGLGSSCVVSNWKARGRIPAKYYRAIVDASGGNITLTDLYKYEEAHKPRK